MVDPYNAGITWLNEPMRGAAEGPLTGRTVFVKDLIDTAGVRTTYGSRIYADHIPERSATVVQRVLDAGAVVIAKANLPEFAWSTLGANPWYGTVHNPVAPGKTTGGSSAGNAAALAAGLCDLGIGTDTGCSIRLPSACCDIVGLKPRWGGIPVDGVFPLSPTLDTVGPMAKTVSDVAMLWSVLARQAIPAPRLHGLTVGLLRQPPGIGDGRPAETSKAAEVWVTALESLGAQVVEARIPDPRANLGPILAYEAKRSHAKTFPSRADEYGPTILPKLEAAQRLQPEQVETAYRALEEWRKWRPDVDVYVSPCYAIELPDEDADETAVRLPISSFLRWVNLIGWAGLAIGNMQLLAPSDQVVLAAGLAWERG